MRRLLQYSQRERHTAGEQFAADQRKERGHTLTHVSNPTGAGTLSLLVSIGPGSEPHLHQKCRTVEEIQFLAIRGLICKVS